MGKPFSDFSKYCAFGLETVEESIDLVHKMGPSGVEVVSGREGEYRYWDPETLKVDRDCEDLFIKKIEQHKLNCLFLSEECGEKDFKGEGERVVVVSDPFDGSLLYKRQIPAFWFTTLAVLKENGQGISAVVGDCAARQVDFSDGNKAYTARLNRGQLEGLRPAKKNSTKELGKAFLETYLMKPHYLYPAAKDFEPLLSKVKFVLPNGGPGGFSDVAMGRTDVYFAHKQPFTDIFAGLPIAEAAGCVITDFDGNKVNYKSDVKSRWHIVCSCTEELHKEVLKVIKDLPRAAL